MVCFRVYFFWINIFFLINCFRVYATEYKDILLFVYTRTLIIIIIIILVMDLGFNELHIEYMKYYDYFIFL